MQVITSHLNADFDCLSSMVAAQKLYPSAKMIFSGSLEKSAQKFLSLHGQSFHFSRMKEIDLKSIASLIVVDTQDPGRIGEFQSVLGNPGLEVHIYDHHMDAVRKIPASKSVVSNRGSCATVMFEILSKQDIHISPQEATLLVLGIYEDTHCLVSPATTPEDFMAVGHLVRKGADLSIVAQYVEPRLNDEQIAVMNDLIRNMEMLNVNGCEFALATAMVEHYVEDVSIVAHKIMELENLDAFFILIGLDRRVYLIARSRVESINVAEITNEFGGGGHATAASASIKDMTVVQVREKFLSVINEKIKPPLYVSDIMHSPAVFVADTATVAAVEKILTRFNLNTLPVVSDGKPVGLITRQIVEKAIHHKMDTERVADFMIREFVVTTPGAYFKGLIPCIIEEKQKLVPVVDAITECLAGVVSRGDLLRVLYSDMVKHTGESEFPLMSSQDKISKNVKSIMQERLPKKVMVLFGQVEALADAMGVSVYVVGGFVRDLLLGIENLDIDIVVEGEGIKFAKALGAKLEGRVRCHEKFGTSVVILENNFKIDIATARMEYYKHPAALPTVEMSSIKSDLFRRDFTINSLAIKLNGANAFRLIDYFNGLRDLKAKTIRVLHNLSFIEDPSRAFRAIRFEQRYQFVLGKQTESFMLSAIQKGMMNHLSGLRVFNELVLILKEKKPLGYIGRLRSHGLLQFVHPDLATPASLEVLRQVEDLLASSRLFPLSKEPDAWFIYLIGLFYFLPEGSAALAMERLHMPKKMRERLDADCRACRDALMHLRTHRALEPSEIYNIFSNMTPEAIMFLLAVSNSENINKKVVLYLSQNDAAALPCLTGDDLIHLGLRPGPKFKAVLNALRDARLNGKLKSREDEMAFVKREFINS